MEQQKTCNACGVEKCIDDFPRAKRYKDGIYTLCRECKKAKSKVGFKSYYERNKDRLNKNRREDGKKNRERDRISHQKWRHAHRDHVLVRRKNHYYRHKEEILRKQREQGKKNRARQRTVKAVYRQKKREALRAYFRAYNKVHRKDYYRRNTQRILYYDKISRARRRGASGHATPVQIQARIDYYGGRCWICREVATAIDHVKPVVRGGSNWPANLRPICTSCNSHKGAKWPFLLAVTRRTDAMPSLLEREERGRVETERSKTA